MDSETELVESYRVEISGWDGLNNFFVERATLEWDERGTKRVSLQSTVRQGSVVFLRLLQSFGDGTGLPVACNAVKVASKDASGAACVHLVPLHARASAKDSVHIAQAIAFRPA